MNAFVNAKLLFQQRFSRELDNDIIKSYKNIITFRQIHSNIIIPPTYIEELGNFANILATLKSFPFPFITLCCTHYKKHSPFSDLFLVQYYLDILFIFFWCKIFGRFILTHPNIGG